MPKKSWVSRRRFLAGTGAVAAGLSFAPKFGWSAEEAKLNFYNWDTYIGETTLADFQKASGIETKMDLFADNGAFDPDKTNWTPIDILEHRIKKCTYKGKKGKPKHDRELQVKVK